MQFQFLWHECTANHLSACARMHVCVCECIFLWGWGVWKELQNIMQSTDMNNKSVYKFQSLSSEFKKLFAAHFLPLAAHYMWQYLIFKTATKFCENSLLWTPTKKRGGGGHMEKWTSASCIHFIPHIQEMSENHTKIVIQCQKTGTCVFHIKLNIHISVTKYN